MLGVTPELGAQVELTYTLADKEQMGREVTDTFTLVGWWEYDELLKVHFFNVSEEYARQIEAMAMAEGMHAFRTDLSVMLSSSLDIENTLKRIGEDCGYSVGDGAGQLRIGVNWGYTATQLADTMDAGGILAVIAVMVLVTFTGYLVIYNIFQISVAGDIRYYGLLKTISVTPRQLRRIIRQQALMLSAVGIPVGLLLGYGVGVLAVPITLSTSIMSGTYTTISLSPWIFLGAAAFALLTVLLSCARPGRIAGSVSPVEAVRYTEVQQSTRKACASRRVTPFSMAKANLGRSRRKTALVMVSLSLAVVLLNLLTTFVTGFDMDKYLSHRSCADFVVSTPDYFHYLGFTLTEEDIRPVRENTEQSLGGFTYGTGLVQMYLPEAYWREEVEYYLRDQDVDQLLSTAKRDGEKIALYSQVEGLDAALVPKLKVLDGDVSPLTRPESRSIAIEVNLDDYGNVVNPENFPAVGEQVRVTYGENETAHDVFYTVCAWVEIPYDMGSRFYAMGYQAVLGADTLRRDAGAENVLNMCYVFDTPQSGGRGSGGEIPFRACRAGGLPADVREQGHPSRPFPGVSDDLYAAGRAAVRHHRHRRRAQFRQCHDDLHPVAAAGIRGAAGCGHDQAAAQSHAGRRGDAVHPRLGPDLRTDLRSRQSAGGPAAGTGLLVLSLSLHHRARAAGHPGVCADGVRHSDDHVRPGGQTKRGGAPAGGGGLRTSHPARRT